MVKVINFMDDVKSVCNLEFPWGRLKDKTVLISGASGMVGTFLIHVLLQKDLNVRVIALGRNAERAKERFQEYWESENFSFLSHNINQKLDVKENVDFVIHAASNTHPVAYATDPIGTILTNLIGTKNMLDLADEKQAERFLFVSSVEVYGENRGDTEYFDETYCGYIDCNTLRAGYPEGKRAGEALCQAYIKQRNMDAVIGRLSRTYGPSMLETDTKAISQFIKKGAAKEDIVLKSEGTQLYSYVYVADAVSALLTILLDGRKGEAYNISDKKSDISLRDLAQMIAGYSGVKVRFELPDETERAGYSKATKALLDSGKLRHLGWSAKWTIEDGIRETLEKVKKKVCVK